MPRPTRHTVTPALLRSPSYSLPPRQDYYPETLGDLFIINAPAVFTTLWPIAKRFVDPKTRGKFHVLGANYTKELLRYIDADKLPEEYGGSCSDTIPAQSPWPADWTPPPVEVGGLRHQACL